MWHPMVSPPLSVSSIPRGAALHTGESAGAAVDACTAVLGTYRMTSLWSSRRRPSPPVSYGRPLMAVRPSPSWVGKKSTVFAVLWVMACHRCSTAIDKARFQAMDHVLSRGTPQDARSRRRPAIDLLNWRADALRSAANSSPSPDAAPEGADTLTRGKRRVRVLDAATPGEGLRGRT